MASDTRQAGAGSVPAKAAALHRLLHPRRQLAWRVVLIGRPKCISEAEARREWRQVHRSVAFAKTQVSPAWLPADPTLEEAWALNLSKTIVEFDARCRRCLNEQLLRVWLAKFECTVHQRMQLLIVKNECNYYQKHLNRVYNLLNGARRGTRPDVPVDCALLVHNLLNGVSSVLSDFGFRSLITSLLSRCNAFSHETNRAHFTKKLSPFCSVP